MDDEDEENHIPSLTAVAPSSTQKQNPTTRSIPPPLKKKPVSAPVQPPVQSPQLVSQLSNEAETMLNDLESSLAQFLNNNNHQNGIHLPSRPTTNDDESNRKSLTKIRSISNLNSYPSHDPTEPSMRVEWLDDAMQAERKKMIDEDESNPNSQGSQMRHGQKRPLVDSNGDQPFKSKRSRI